MRDQLGDGLTARPEQRSIEQVAQQVTQKLLPLFAQESRHLEPATREAITLAVARTLITGKIDADLLLQQRLDPTRLVNTLVAKAPESSAAFSPDETSLYRRLLTESCRHLVGIANHFAGYEILVDRRLLTGQEQVLAQLARLLAEPDERSRTCAGAYRTQLSKQLNKFEQIGIDYAQRATDRQPLAVAYVALRLMQGDGSSYEELPARHARRYQQDDGFEAERLRRTIGSIQEMLAYAPRLVIQGQPGSGKSTLLRWLAIQIAQRSLSQEHPALASWDECIPFYIQLRTFVNKPLPTPSEWPTHQVRQLALKAPDTWMHEVLSDGRAVVLIDGVDETPEGQRAELLQWLQELISTYPWARYIITSRPAAIKLWPEWIDWSRSSGFLTLSLQEMELEQSFHFIEQWHDALQQSLSDAAQREEVAALAEPLKQLVRQRDALRRLARNPLLCSMICALHREHSHTMPQNRIKLYQDCVEMLMHRRDAERKVGSLADYPPLTNIHEEVVLRDYAHHLMLIGESEEDQRDADRYFEELLQRINLPGWTGARLRHYFVARTGLLFEPGEGRIAFAHRTFQEFLAAREIVKKNEIRMLINKARDDQWRETILLTIGIPEINAKQSDLLLNGILNKAHELTTPRYRYELYLLAVACLETAIYLTPPMRRHILAKAAALIPPRNDDAIALIVKGGDPMVELLRLNPDYSFKKMARCVEALITIGSEQALDAVVEYATSPIYEYPEAWSLRRAVVRGLFTFEPRYYCQRVLVHVSMLDLTSTPLSDSELVHFQDLPRLQSLDLAYTQVNDASLSYLRNLRTLHLLDLSSTQISDTGLYHLSNLAELRDLSLINTQVTDLGLFHLQSLTKLQSLDLDSTQVTDVGLPYLQNFITLQSLDLDSTDVSDVGLIHLQSLERVMHFLRGLRLFPTRERQVTMGIH
ncbi:MAG: NACHT domain-containing protein [Caldilineaceae bacterium]